jgi:hypothetical protein
MQPRHSACQGAKWPITQAVTDPFHAPFSWRARVGKRRDRPRQPREGSLPLPPLCLGRTECAVSVP